MSRFPPSSCISCGETHWGKPELPCNRCRPKSVRAEGRVQAPKSCADCGKPCTGQRCWECYLAQAAAPPPRCIECGAELSARRAKRCRSCANRQRVKPPEFKPTRLARRRGVCLDLSRTGFRCPISWGPLDHRHCRHCFRPMRPDQEQCSGCTALELLADRIELTTFMPASSATRTAPIEGSKAWRTLDSLVDFDELRTGEEAALLEAEADFRATGPDADEAPSVRVTWP